MRSSGRIIWRIYERTKRKETEDIYIYSVKYYVPLHIFTILSYYYAARESTNCGGEDYRNQVESSQNAITSIPVPRGQILDREGKTVVNNKPLRTITYTRVKGITSEAVLKTAKDLAEVLEMLEQDINKLTDIDKKIFGCS